MSAFKRGDKVVYSCNHMVHTKSLDGLTGVVCEDQSLNATIVSVRFESGYTMLMLADNLRLAAEVSKYSVAEALAVLRAAGDVTFKPRKPEWKTARVEAVAGYDGVINAQNCYERFVRFGCHQVSFAKVLEVAEMVKKAQEYNAS